MSAPCGMQHTLMHRIPSWQGTGTGGAHDGRGSCACAPGFARAGGVGHGERGPRDVGAHDPHVQHAAAPAARMDDAGLH